MDRGDESISEAARGIGEVTVTDPLLNSEPLPLMGWPVGGVFRGAPKVSPTWSTQFVLHV